MKKIKLLSDIKKISFQGLRAFDSFCKKYNLKYSLAGGTMLGAVRHKGFIPWDDDIDLYMERIEYDKLISLIKNGKVLEDSDFEFLLPKQDKYPYPFIKIVNKKTIVYEKNVNPKYAIGVWLDIFPIDNCGNSIKEVRKVVYDMEKLSRKISRTIVVYTQKTAITYLKTLYITILKFIFRMNYKKYVNKKLTYKFPEDSIYKGNMIWIFWDGKDKFCDVYPAEYFDGYTEIEFEGEKFMIFSHYDEILRKRYGDYMKLPKEEDRVGHEFCAYYLD